MDSDFDKDELKSLDTEIKRLEKQKQVIAEKIDRLLHLYLSGSWSQEQLDENKNILDTQLSNLDDVLKERKRKRELIESKQINYNTVADFLSVANRFDQLLDAKEQQELIGSLFPTATLDLENATLILHAQLPQLVKIDINVRIETTEEVSARVLLDTAEKRYKEAQKHLNSNKGITLIELAKELDIGSTTLWKDQKRFGRLRYLAPDSKEIRKERVEIVTAALRKNPHATGRELHEITGINRTSIYEIIRSEGLKP